MKNILFFSVSIGGGHDSAAKSLEDQFKDKVPGIKTKIVDTFDYINPTLNKVVVGSYMETIKFNPKVWGYLYRQAENGDKMVDLGQVLNKLLSYKLNQMIEEFQPDAIVCTHAFPAGILSVLKEKTGMEIPVFVVLTDYTVHAFWVHSNIDYYFIPSEQLIYESMEQGMLAERIRPYGIPIRKEFCVPVDKERLKKEMDLDHRPVVLVMGGGWGLGEVKKSVSLMLATNANIQILAVAGKNNQLYEQLEELSKKHSNLKTFGYVKNIYELMSVADMIVTKPGGVTTAEALAKKLPMVIINPLPGQEDRNTDFLLNMGVAVKAKENSTLPLLVNQLFNNKLRMKHMREMAEYLAKPDAAEDIVGFIRQYFTEKS